jgi:inhibitor of KinA
MTNTPTVFPLGDSAITVEFGTNADETTSQLILQVFRSVKAKEIEWILDVVPAYASLTIHYDVQVMYSKGMDHPYKAVEQLLIQVLQEQEFPVAEESRMLEIPVCYDDEFAPDLKQLCKQKGLTIEQAIEIHVKPLYRIYMIGFLPGFAYMGMVDPILETPRLEQPRKKVAAGSVGIADRQTGVYPLSSPGGWQIIGRTPVSLFDPVAKTPVLFQPGDSIRFYPITRHEFDHYQTGHS